MLMTSGPKKRPPMREEVVNKNSTHLVLPNARGVEEVTASSRWSGRCWRSGDVKLWLTKVSATLPSWKLRPHFYN